MNTESMRRRQPDYYLTTICKTPGVIAPQWLRAFSIRFLSSDCPDKVCVNTGFLREDLQVATCLPNRTTLFLSVSQE